MENEGLLVGKDGESVGERWHLQGCSPRLCHLRIDLLTLMSKY
jgi:hypothetical protein